MRHNLKQIHEETKITTIYVTHDQSESLSMGTQITVMNKGKMVQTEEPKNSTATQSTLLLLNLLGKQTWSPRNLSGFW